MKKSRSVQWTHNSLNNHFAIISAVEANKYNWYIYCLIKSHSDLDLKCFRQFAHFFLYIWLIGTTIKVFALFHPFGSGTNIFCQGCRTVSVN